MSLSTPSAVLLVFLRDIDLVIAGVVVAALELADVTLLDLVVAGVVAADLFGVCSDSNSSISHGMSMFPCTVLFSPSCDF